MGYALTGIGVSPVAPIVVSAAGSCISHMKPTQAIAFVSSASLLGIMAGPSFIGVMSGVLGQLRWSFALEALLVLQMSCIGFYLGQI